MKIVIFHLVLILIISLLFKSIKCKVTLAYHLKNYENPDDRAADGWLCDVHYFDTCDPIFFICFQSYSSNCNIYYKQKDHQNSLYNIPSVEADSFELDYLEHIYLYVKVEDQDIYYHDLIAKFSADISLIQLPVTFTKSLYRERGARRVSLDVFIDARCSTNYYGPKCKKYCVNSRTYFCDSYGRKHCQLSCGTHGRCEWSLHREEFICTCSPGYSGTPCQLITTTTKFYNTTTSRIATNTTYVITTATTTTTSPSTSYTTTTSGSTTGTTNSKTTNQALLSFDIDINERNNTNVESRPSKLVSFSKSLSKRDFIFVFGFCVILVITLVASILSVAIRWYRRKQVSRSALGKYHEDDMRSKVISDRNENIDTGSEDSVI